MSVSLVLLSEGERQLLPPRPIPIPRAAGPAPRLVELKPADDGKVTVPVNRPVQAVGGVVVIGGANPNGGPIQV